MTGITGMVMADDKTDSLYRVVTTQPSMDWAYRVESTESNCVLIVLAPAYDLEKKDSSVVLSLPAPSAWTKPGEPRLPVFPAVFEVGDNVQYQIKVESGEADKKQIGYLDPVPTMGNVSESDDEGRVMEYLLPEPSIYRENGFWPSTLYTIDEAKGGGRRYLRVGIMPFQYNAWSQTLKYHSNMQVRVSFTQPEIRTSP